METHPTLATSRQSGNLIASKYRQADRTLKISLVLALVTGASGAAAMHLKGAPLEQLLFLVTISVVVLTERINEFGKLAVQRLRDEEAADLKTKNEQHATDLRDELKALVEGGTRDLKNLFNDRVDLICLGRPGRGLAWMTQAMQSGGASGVKDSIFRIGRNASFETTKEYNAFVEATCSFLERNGRYVIVGNDVGLAMSDQFVRPNVKRPNLTARRLETPVQMVNFSILRYDTAQGSGKPPEVLFGWDYDDCGDMAFVFLSRDPRLVEYFDGLFAALVRNRATEEYLLPTS